MKLTVIGLGYLGATHAVAMADLGHQVIGIEPNLERLKALQQGKLPFYEPGLDKALVAVIAKGQITFKQFHDEDSRDAELHFLAVGTPQLAGSDAADTSYLFAAIEDLAPFLSEQAVVVGKSTVPVGTATDLTEKLASLVSFSPRLAWNPEFLREGTALEDSLRPDRIVIGTEDPVAEKLIRKVYKPITDITSTPVLVMDVVTSELVKVAANSFLATKISFINAMAEIAEASGGDAVRLAEAIGLDERIGKQFLRNGIGFGGGCLPKDIRAFSARAQELGVGEAVEFLKDIDEINLRRRERVVQLAKTELIDLRGKNILILGASFKPLSDDLRDSPALAIAKRLVSENAVVKVHDPMAMQSLDKLNLGVITGELAALAENADLVILATEWKEYKELDPTWLGSLVGTKTIIDGRNALNVASYQKAGWRLIALGRNVHR